MKELTPEQKKKLTDLLNSLESTAFIRISRISEIEPKADITADSQWSAAYKKTVEIQKEIIKLIESWL